MATAQDAEQAQRVQEQRLAAVMEELKKAGWTQEQLFTKAPLIDTLVRSFTADELRQLAELKSWPRSK